MTSFAEITSDVDVEMRLAATYSDVDEIDAWVGALAEDHVPGALVGELVLAVLSEQFTSLRDGDRFWYELVFSGSQLQELQETTLADIIRRNTKIRKEIQDNVFLEAPAETTLVQLADDELVSDPLAFVRSLLPSP